MPICIVERKIHVADTIVDTGTETVVIDVAACSRRILCRLRGKCIATAQEEQVIKDVLGARVVFVIQIVVVAEESAHCQRIFVVQFPRVSDADFQ